MNLDDYLSHGWELVKNVAFQYGERGHCEQVVFKLGQPNTLAGRVFEISNPPLTLVEALKRCEFGRLNGSAFQFCKRTNLA